MPEFYETTVDKFIFKVAADRLYSRDGIWALNNGQTVRIGLSDYVQQRSGDVAFIDVNPTGSDLQAGADAARVETIKVNLDVASPISGKIAAINPKMELEPEVINLDPYGEGWIFEVEAADWETDQAKLLDAQTYFNAMKLEAEEESKNL